MTTPYTRDKIETWVSDFTQSDRMAEFPVLVQEYAPEVLVCLLFGACEVRDVEPDEITEPDLRMALLDGVGHLELPQSVKPDIPALCGAFLELLEVQGRLGGGADLGQYVRALKNAFLEKIQVKPITRPGSKLGRNDPCPCGSGQKYKKCCMDGLG